MKIPLSTSALHMYTYPHTMHVHTYKCEYAHTSIIFTYMQNYIWNVCLDLDPDPKIPYYMSVNSSSKLIPNMKHFCS